LGEITTLSHAIETGGRTTYNSGKAFFEETASRESFKSNRYKELALDYSTDTSDRVAARRLNRMRLEYKGVIPTTYRNLVEREGAAIQERIEQKCEDVLLRNGFDRNAELQEGVTFTPDRQSHINQAAIENAAINLNIWDYDAPDYESPENAVNISIDEVCVKRQTEKRPQLKPYNPMKVHTTVCLRQGLIPRLRRGRAYRTIAVPIPLFYLLAEAR
jgi:hypothetical protein